MIGRVFIILARGKPLDEVIIQLKGCNMASSPNRACQTTHLDSAPKVSIV